MKKIIYLLIIALSNFYIVAYSQTTVDNANYTNFKYLPQEKIYAHLNSTFLITGDYLYYKVYCQNIETNNLSKISKIVYVELIDTNKKIIFKHKLRLNDGLGQGDFFIPSSIPSGNYKLIAYTQWMRNVSENSFFQNDIGILNPFQLNQNQIVDFTKLDSLKPLKVISNSTTSSIRKNKNILLELTSKKFKNREKVTLKLSSLKNNKSYGDYSISVRKIENIGTPNRAMASNYSPKYIHDVKSKPSIKNNSIYLPELRGELISGKIIVKETNKPIANINVALSIPDKDFILKISKTNKYGVFYFNIKEEYKNTDILIQLTDGHNDTFKIVVDEQTPINYSELNFNTFRIPLKYHDSILKHSIYNQIENAYSSVKLNKYKPLTINEHFFIEEIDVDYFLDDYTRFPTLKETIVEVITPVWISKKAGQYAFHVRSSNLESNFPPLLIVDGVFISNHNELIDYDAKKIKRISIVRDNYIYGSKLFKGVISIETFNGNYKGGLLSIKWNKSKIDKVYYSQEYNNTDSINRIPDFRTQLLWLPDFKLDKKEKVITFFTSDNNGEYEICLEGFTKEGKPVSLGEVFSVE